MDKNVINRVGKIIEDNIFGEVAIVLNEDKEVSQFEVGDDVCYEVIIESNFITWYGYYSLGFFDDCSSFEDEKEVIQIILEEYKMDILSQFFKTNPIERE